MSETREGYTRLWGWFGLTYASFLVLPRSLMHEMPDEWQANMANLLEEFGETFPGYDDECRVQKTKHKKLVRWPEWILNYRRPDVGMLNALRPDTGEQSRSYGDY